MGAVPMRRSSFAVRRSSFGVRFVVRRSSFAAASRPFVVAVARLVSGDGAAGVRRARRRAGHLPADQRRLHDRADRRPRRPGARRDAEAEPRRRPAARRSSSSPATSSSPSVASSVFKGEHMIAALNAAGLDLATLGNHEFDFGDDVLIQRMHEATFQWVVSNVVDTNTGQPIGGAAPYLVKTFGALKVGFIGLCLNTQEITGDKLKHTRIVDPLTAAGRYLPMLKQAGATVIVAVTHLAFADDRALVEQYPGDRSGHRRPRALPDHRHRDTDRSSARPDRTRSSSRASTSTSGPAARSSASTSCCRSRARSPTIRRPPPSIASFESRLSTALDTVVGTTQRAARRRERCTCARRRRTSATWSPTRSAPTRTPTSRSSTPAASAATASSPPARSRAGR